MTAPRDNHGSHDPTEGGLASSAGATSDALLPSQRQTLVIGATGKSGRRVLERLEEAGVPTLPASRSSQVRFDWEDESTWPSALARADAAFVTFFPDLAIPGADLTVRRFVAAARSHGVNRVVLLSGRGEAGARRAEQELQRSDLDWTIVRCGFFSQNFSETFPDPIRHGVLALPTDDVEDPFLDADDIADVVVAALLDDSHVGQLYELTGPRLVKLSEAASILGEAIGRPVEFISMPIDDYVETISEMGYPGDVARHIADVIALALDGRNANLTGDVEQVLGRPARDFADYARNAAASGAWDL